MLGRFRYNPKDEIKTQTESNDLQPFKFFFTELGTGGWAGRQWGEREEKEKEKERRERLKSDNPNRRGKGCRADQLPPPRIQRCPVGSVSTQALKFQRGQVLEENTGRTKTKGPQRRPCGPFIGCLPMCRACICTCSSCHTCCPPRQPSLAGLRAGPCASAVWYSPAGCCGGFFKDRVSRSGSGHGITAVSRQKAVHSGLLHTVMGMAYGNQAGSRESCKRRYCRAPHPGGWDQSGSKSGQAGSWLKQDLTRGAKGKLVWAE